MDKKSVDELIAELPKKERYDIDDLIDLVTVLRDQEKGCPWDKVQTHSTIKKDLLEEVYEVMEAIDFDSPEMMREELGDVLLQVIFHVVLEEERGSFVLDDVITELCQKLIIRHPHVFGDVQADTVDTVLSNWDSIKKDTKGQESYTDTLKSVPKNFPALMRAQKLGKRAARAGIDFEKCEEDGTELDLYSAITDALNRIKQADLEEEDASNDLGKLLFLCSNLARRLDCDAEECLADSCNNFINRFEGLEKHSENISEVSAEELYSY
ncbi:MULTISPECIES: nucleoside triphosphate pyrophosphohydrolase [Ruminococcus]|uniref:MazG family protein n=1 Tax=Ruminococcus albus (strain ATCC 27210 / DSM 20455 / JCM 14654 / NCDO 2250 / 7) TaxID=697329 RepID=E6UHP1_RUMA7|nr:MULTISPECIES: nucleoside triphosphate pyrophosphohydrolase [Ruminococcus]ADU22090.1 MazG family protein [Ruminococcus albus 7 = DSM 20455]MCR5020801.1 nucleoside triphosphate pyrophosphohydrolase [Ruminococcus sp.]